MSLMPFYDMPQMCRPGSIFDQHFGVGLLHDDLLQPRFTPVPLLSGYLRPWRHQVARHSGISNIQYDKDGFKVILDVQQFKPSEVTVKIVHNSIVVEGKHKERGDEHGFISRQFLRRYRLPDDVEGDKVGSKLSSDGVLTIEAPTKTLPPTDAKERVVNITYTNTPAALSRVGGQGNAKEDNQDKMDQ